MIPTIRHLTAQSHIDDLHRDARRHHLYEETRRQMIRMAPPRRMIRLAPPRQLMRRPRLAAGPSHH
jgi:hypothetical protein